MKSSFSRLLLLLTLFTWWTLAEAWEISGSLKPEFCLTCESMSASSVRYVFRTPLRLMLRQTTRNLEFNLAWIVNPTAGNPALRGNEAGSEQRGFRITDIREMIFPSDWNGDENFSVLQNLDRLSISLKTPEAVLTAGRQAIYWGVAKSVSPTDFISPFQYGTLNTEHRTGVDALRSIFPVGMMSELEAGYIFGKNARFADSGYWLRGRFYLFRTDATILGACFRENLMLGGSLNRSLGAGTGWLEIAIVSTDLFSSGEESGKDMFWSLSTGYDRSWMNAALYGYLEYHFNSPGSDSPSDYPDIAASPAWTEGGIYLLGKHYLSPGLSWALSPLISLSATGLVNLTDASAYISLSGEYSFRDDIVFNLGYSHALEPVTPEDSSRTEFASWPGVCLISSEYYF